MTRNNEKSVKIGRPSGEARLPTRELVDVPFATVALCYPQNAENTTRAMAPSQPQRIDNQRSAIVDMSGDGFNTNRPIRGVHDSTAAIDPKP